MSIEQRLKEIRRESSSDAAGDPERFRRVALTEHEMMSQGEAISATLAANKGPLADIGRDLAGRTIRRVVTVGCGDSWIAGHGVRPAIEAALGAPCEPVEAFDFATYGLHTIDAETVVIGLSSSGKTEPVVEGLTASAAPGGIYDWSVQHAWVPVDGTMPGCFAYPRDTGRLAHAIQHGRNGSDARDGGVGAKGERR